MQIDAAIGHPEGAAIHQPRTTPWESRSRKHTSPDSALDQRLDYVLGQLRGFDPGCLTFCRLLSQSRCGERPLSKSCRTSALGCDCAMCTANGSSRSTPSARQRHGRISLALRGRTKGQSRERFGCGASANSRDGTSGCLSNFPGRVAKGYLEGRQCFGEPAVTECIDYCLSHGRIWIPQCQLLHPRNRLRAVQLHKSARRRLARGWVGTRQIGVELFVTRGLPEVLQGLPSCHHDLRRGGRESA